MKLSFGITLAILLTTSLTSAQTLQSAIDQFESGDYATAKRTFQSIESSNESNPEYFYYFGRTEFEMDEFGNAVKKFEKAKSI